MNNQDLVDMYRAGVVISENEHLQYSPPTTFNDLPKVVVVGAGVDTSGELMKALQTMQADGKVGIISLELDLEVPTLSDEARLNLPKFPEELLPHSLEGVDKFLHIDRLIHQHYFFRNFPEPKRELMNNANLKHAKPWYVKGRY